MCIRDSHMAAQPWVDPARIGIYGWSYGGFMALSCAMKGLGLFKMAIAVAPVTSWRYYDTIYTEIYNNLPQYNACLLYTSGKDKQRLTTGEGYYTAAPSAGMKYFITLSLIHI